MKKYILALDQGTTSTRAIAFDQSGTPRASASRQLKQYYPSSGWVEHNPEEIFADSVAVIREVIAAVGADSVAAIGITNQRETALVWDKSGKAVYNAVVWQCRRTAHLMEKLKASDLEPRIYAKTGLVCDAYFSASKIKWILDNAETKSTKNLFAGTVDSYLLYRLTGGKTFATDYTNASRTMLYDIHALRWDDELCDLFGVPKTILPEVLPSSAEFGTTDIHIVGAQIPICALAGDQQSALFGQQCFEPGQVKNTYGTGCFLLMNTGKTAIESRRGLITTLAAGLDKTPDYVLEGSVFIGGAAVQWLRDEMRLITSSAESETVAKSIESSGGVYVVPAFVGLGAPHWDQDARGLITGMTRGTGRAHIVRATLESIAYQVFDVLHAMERDLGVDVTSLCVDGGASANNFLMQFQADILGATVLRPEVVETTALGAAYLAGLKCGFWKDLSDLKSASAYTEFHPSLPESKRREMLLGWEEAIARAKIK